MLVPIWAGVIKDGKLVINGGDDYDAWLGGMEGKNVEFIVRRVRRRRSMDAAAFYFGVVVEIIRQELGMQVEECHAFLKATLLAYPKTSITQLDSQGFSEYLEDVICFATTELGLRIPDPKKVTF